MCNLSAAFAEDITKEVTKEVTIKVKEEDKKSFAESLIELVNDNILTIAQAAKTLKISEEEFKAYME